MNTHGIPALQRAIDYIEKHIDSRLPVESVARASFYSAPHLSWMFRDVAGVSIGEYIRTRRISRAAVAILNGDEIVDVALGNGFSSQQVFTRCFTSYFGVPPATFRRHRRNIGMLVPKLILPNEGETMKLIPYYNWKNSDAVDELMERILTANAIGLMEKVASGPIDSTDVDEKTVENLLYIRALRREGNRLAANVPVILRNDTARMTQAAEVLGTSLGNEISAAADPHILDDHPRVKNELDRRLMSHFLASQVTLGWQGHEMLMRIGCIPTVEENTDDEGRWYLLRFFEPVEDEYTGKKKGGGGTFCGTRFSLSTVAVTRDQNILGHFAGMAGAPSEDVYLLRLKMIEVLIDGLGGYAESNGSAEARHAALSDDLGLSRNGKIDALVLTADEFEKPADYIRAIYSAMEDWWKQNQSAIDEVLDKMTPKSHGIENRHLYHWAWGSIVGRAWDSLETAGFFYDLDTLPNGAINVFWENSLDLQGDCISNR